MKSRKQFFIISSICFIMGGFSHVLVSCQTLNSTRGGSIRQGEFNARTHPSDHTVMDAIHSAEVGGTAGLLIGRDMDKQSKALKSDLKGAQVERAGEGILITFSSNLWFGHDSFELQGSAKSILKDFARLLVKHEYTSILVEGHTDNTGEELYNRSLSEKRALEIEAYLVRQGVKDARIITRGYGESQPLATNDSELGKRANRRIEFAIFANEEMKQLAKKGSLGDYIASRSKR